MKWNKVVFAADLPKCDCCEDAYCPIHNMHFSECSCIGPTMDDVEYKEKNGVLYGRMISQHCKSNSIS